MLNLEKTLQQIKKTALIAGKNIIANWHQINIRYKGKEKEVCTNLDQETEKYIIDEIKKIYPAHNIYGEEYGIKNNQSNYTWYIDPIDGTDNFSKKIPIFCISIALAEKNEPILGLVYNPATHELFYGIKGHEAYHEITTHDHLLTSEEITLLKVSDIDSFAKAEVHIGMPKKISPTKKQDQALLKKLVTLPEKIRNIGSGALSLCYTASGAFDAFIDLTGPLRPFDIAAGILIIKEAGGKISDFNGNYFDLSTKRLLASNGLIHDEILKML